MVTKQQINNILKKMPKSLMVVGSVARKEEIINDLDFITSKKLSDVINDIKKKFKNVKIIRQGTKQASILINNIPIDIFRYTKPEEKIFIKFARTNKKGENIYYRNQAKKKGMLLNDRGLYRNNDRVPIKSITQLKKLLKN